MKSPDFAANCDRWSTYGIAGGVEDGIYCGGYPGPHGGPYPVTATWDPTIGALGWWLAHRRGARGR